MVKLASWIFLLFLPLYGQSQIINTERLRVNASEEGWSGTLGFTFRYIQNTRQLLQGGVKGGIEYLKGKHRGLLFSNFKISRANEEDLVNDGFFHGRYNLQANEWLYWEAFSQVQYNSIQKIGYRLLNGGGLRFKLIHNDTLRLYLGTTYMFEINRFTDSLSTFRRIHRQSNYLSFGFSLNPNLVIDQVAYFQPAWTDFSDLRFSSETRFQFNITQRLALQLTFSLLYDTRTLEGLPDLYLDLLSGLNFTF